MPRAPSTKRASRTSPKPALPRYRQTLLKPINYASWPASTLDRNVKISTTRAKHLYRLEMTDLRFLPREISSAVVTDNGERKEVVKFLYRERAVERTAWKKHGGPHKFYSMMNRLRATHDNVQQAKPHEERKTFEAPDGFKVWLARRGDKLVYYPSRTIMTPEERWTKTPELLRLRNRCHRWVWDAMVNALEQASRTRYGNYARGDGLSDEERQALIESGLRSLRYPQRPAKRLPTSRSRDALRDVLAVAPTPKSTRTQYSQAWDATFLEALSTALAAVIQRHGVDKEGWMSMRWEIYDAFTSRVGGIRYDIQHSRWHDDAAIWLCGRMKSIPAGYRHVYDEELMSVLPLTDRFGKLERDV